MGEDSSFAEMERSWFLTGSNGKRSPPVFVEGSDSPAETPDYEALRP